MAPPSEAGAIASVAKALAHQARGPEDGDAQCCDALEVQGRGKFRRTPG